jgi:hypothetical protein
MSKAWVSLIGRVPVKLSIQKLSDRARSLSMLKAGFAVARLCGDKPGPSTTAQVVMIVAPHPACVAATR